MGVGIIGAGGVVGHLIVGSGGEVVDQEGHGVLDAGGENVDICLEVVGARPGDSGVSVARVSLIDDVLSIASSVVQGLL